MAFFGTPKVEKLKAKGSVEGLIDLLTNEKNYKIRKSAAEALGELGDGRAVGSLCLALRDSDADVRASAAEALGNIGDSQAVEPLIAVLYDNTWDVRGYAIEALKKIGNPRALGVFLRAMRDPNASVRKHAAEALGNIGDARAVKPLIAALKYKEEDAYHEMTEEYNRLEKPSMDRMIAVLKDSYVHSYIIDALVKIGQPARNSLIPLLTDKDVEMRKMAAQVLSQIGLPEDEMVQIQYLIAGQEWGLLIPYGKAAVEPLIDFLSDKDADVRKQVAKTLTEIGEPAVEAVIEAMANPDHMIRKQAADILQKIGGPMDRKTKIQYFVANQEWSMAVSFGKDAVEPLLAILTDNHAEIRKEAAKSLGELGDMRAADPMIQLLDDSNSSVRQSAAEALGRIGDGQAVEKLCQLALDKDAGVRQSVAEALGSIGHARALEPLVASLSDDVWEVRKSAAKGLLKLYKRHSMDNSVKQKILSQKGIITKLHQDSVKTDSNGDTIHQDTGIGLRFY